MSEELIRLLQIQCANQKMKQYISIDDINHINNWNKVITWIINNKLFQNAVILLSSSDKHVCQQIKKNYELKDENNIHIYPLSFRESILLKDPHQSFHSIDLVKEFNLYLLHGGYLPAINDMATSGKISSKTLALYSSWLIKEFLLQGKHQNFVYEILAFIINHYTLPISLNGLTKELSIEHPKTIGSYLESLSNIDALFIQSALIEEKLLPAPKKARKLIFTDPFIAHALHALVKKNESDIEIQMILDNAELYTCFVKASVISHFRRYYPTFYIKNEGDIDLAYVTEHQFWPIIISWGNQLRSKDLKQIAKYFNGRILTKGPQTSLIEHVRTESLLQVLWNLG